MPYTIVRREAFSDTTFLWDVEAPDVAAAALLAAAFYLLLSGAEVATQRSFLMTAVVLIAVIVDRRAITFRTLAIAALIVLLIAPEALVHPSFQMSFAATLGLVALVQVGMPALFAKADSSATARAALWGGREIAMLALASLIAGLATLPYAAYHFHRVTPYGVIANLLAMPVVSAIVMPAGLLGLDRHELVDATLVTAASRTETSCAFRCRTSRSSISNATMNALNATQTSRWRPARMSKLTGNGTLLLNTRSQKVWSTSLGSAGQRRRARRPY